MFRTDVGCIGQFPLPPLAVDDIIDLIHVFLLYVLEKFHGL